jgi:predicted regulator of Ras-like GTPase activity (Roadblock/LC7/MglB family)
MGLSVGNEIKSLKWVDNMAGDTLGEVAGLLEETLKAHRSVKQAVLCTTEGVVVAAVSREGDTDPRLLATVSAALVWGGTSALGHLKKAGLTHLIQTTKIERVLTIIQPHYQLVVVLSRANDAGLNLEQIVPTFQSLATRMELVMGSTRAFGKQTILGTIVEQIPEITQAILLTIEGLPLGSVGFSDEIEVAGLISSLFANGLTYSDVSHTISVNTRDIRLLITRVDENRILAAVCRGPNSEELSLKVQHVLDESV